MAKQSSDMERRADEAERETEKMKKAEYMRQKIGRVYDGVISGLTAWGLYVELPNTVEGLVHVSNLTDDRYYYDEEKHEMTGAGTGRTFCLGQRVRVRVLDADKESRTVDFAIVYKGGMRMARESVKLIANNKKAYHDYFIDETYEAGIALCGTEVKSLRMGKCSIKESFIRVETERCLFTECISAHTKKVIFLTKTL